MYRLLLASTATLALIAASSAPAQTVIDTMRTIAIRTSTVKSGTADAVSIAAAGGIAPAAATQ